MGASLVLTLLLGGHAIVTPTFDPQLCSSLLRMGAIERLSQLLHPVLERPDSAKTKKLGASSNNIPVALYLRTVLIWSTLHGLQRFITAPS